MAVSELNRTAPFGAITVFRVITLIEGAIQGLRRRATAVDTARSLARLTDAQLRDIGLERGNIDEVARKLARI